MKRTWLIVGVLLVAMLAVVAVAEARGPGYGSTNGSGGRGAWGGGEPGFMAGGRGMMGGGRGMMGGGRGMMGGGRGMMGGTCNGENYDPAAMLEQHQAMITQQETLLAQLQEQLANTSDEKRTALLERNIERHQLMLTYQKGKLPIIEALPADWLDGALSLAQYDVTFFKGATSNDAWIQSWLANRLARAEQRLTYLEGLKEQ
ncbi:MAG: hypothetical protein ACOY94_12825 [Bacillota bacterium]